MEPGVSRATLRICTYVLLIAVCVCLLLRVQRTGSFVIESKSYSVETLPVVIACGFSIYIVCSLPTRPICFTVHMFRLVM